MRLYGRRVANSSVSHFLRILRHIWYGDAELKEILQQVNLQNLVSRIDGFDTEVPWENILSLGEQQRLAFARLLINRPNFTILDEATSALDDQSEIEILKNIQSLKGKVTVIIVTHKKNILDYCDKIYSLSRGNIVQVNK